MELFITIIRLHGHRHTWSQNYYFQMSDNIPSRRIAHLLELNEIQTATFQFVCEIASSVNSIAGCVTKRC